MILKLYELYDFAARMEQAKENEKNAYKKPAGKGQRNEVEYVDDVVLLDDEDTTFGAGVGAKNKKAQKKLDAAAQQEKDSKKQVVKKTDAAKLAQEEAAKKKVSTVIKDITVQPPEDIVNVDESR